MDQGREHVGGQQNLKGDGAGGSKEDVEKLRQQYNQALEDLKQVKQNLQRIETLSKDLKLDRVHQPMKQSAIGNSLVEDRNVEEGQGFHLREVGQI